MPRGGRSPKRKHDPLPAITRRPYIQSGRLLSALVPVKSVCTLERLALSKQKGALWGKSTRLKKKQVPGVVSTALDPILTPERSLATDIEGWRSRETWERKMTKRRWQKKLLHNIQNGQWRRKAALPSLSRYSNQPDHDHGICRGAGKLALQPIEQISFPKSERGDALRRMIEKRTGRWIGKEPQSDSVCKSNHTFAPRMTVAQRLDLKLGQQPDVKPVSPCQKRAGDPLQRGPQSVFYGRPLPKGPRRHCPKRLRGQWK